MSVSAATLLSQTEDAISALLQAIANVNVQEYEGADGRRIKRADFPATLRALQASRNLLASEANATTRKRFSFAKLGVASGTLR